MRISMTDETKRIFVGHDTTRHKLIDMVNWEIEPYGGSLHGDTDAGLVDVEFPTLLQAVSFISETGMTEWAVLRDDAASVIDQFTVIRFSMVTFLARHLLATVGDAPRERVQPGVQYRDVLLAIPGALVDCYELNSAISGGFSLEVSFPNSYGVNVVRRDLSYGGGECIALMHDGRLLTEGGMPDGTDIPVWNDLRLADPAHALRVARQVAALPAVD